MSTGKLVLLRHGQSTWNLENLFTGWVDVDLSEQGRIEATEAGRLLREEGIAFDLAFTSVLKRAIRTLWIALDQMDMMWLPVERSWRLNERHYGALQGLDKAETVARHGAEQVKVWRRSYDIPPPPLSRDDPQHPRYDRRYAGVPAGELPDSESPGHALHGRIDPKESSVGSVPALPVIGIVGYRAKPALIIGRRRRDRRELLCVML